MNQIEMNLQTPANKKRKPASQTAEKTKKEKWPEAGLIFCDREQTWCGNVDTNTGKCRASRCNIHDPEYIARQKEMAENMRRNSLKENKESKPDSKEEKKMFSDQIMKEHVARRRWVENCFKEKRFDRGAKGKTGKAIQMPKPMREKQEKLRKEFEKDV